MFTTRLGAALAALTVIFIPARPAPAQAEIRGVWCSRFQWTSENPTTSQNNLTSLFNNMQTGHFNTCFLQMRGQCDTLFPSPDEPWSPLISNPDGTSPGWDPLAYSINLAHARGIKLHAYFNTHTIWQAGSSPSSNPPNPAHYPNHIYYQHGNPADPAKRDWLLHDNAGNPAAFHEYYWMNPGIPAADAYVRKQAAYLVSNYDIDGLHFDRCRMSSPGFGRNPIAVARWDDPATQTPNDGPGNPAGLGWDDFMRDCVTRQIINICGQCWGIKPHVLMSSSPLGLWDFSAYQHIAGYSSGFQYGYGRGQDAKAWMHAGAQDFVVPQIYWDNGNGKPDFNEVFDDWLSAANAAGRKMVPGSNMSNGQAEVEAHALYVRAQGGAGHNVWHSGNTQWSSWSAPGHPYESATPPVPDFPWRSTDGVITGHVYLDTTHTLAAVDARVSAPFTSWKALASGDGFFCFLRVPPGTYDLTASGPGLAEVKAEKVVVKAGEATHITLSPGGAGSGSVDLESSATLFQQLCSGTGFCKIKTGMMVTNHGTAISGKSAVRYFLSNDGQLDTAQDTVIKTFKLSKVKPGKPKKVNKSVKLEAPNTDKYVFAKVDPDNVLEEKNETNNVSRFGPLR